VGRKNNATREMVVRATQMPYFSLEGVILFVVTEFLGTDSQVLLLIVIDVI
jgi:hypothetical protein